MARRTPSLVTFADSTSGGRPFAALLPLVQKQETVRKPAGRRCDMGSAAADDPGTSGGYRVNRRLFRLLGQKPGLASSLSTEHPFGIQAGCSHRGKMPDRLPRRRRLGGAKDCSDIDTIVAVEIGNRARLPEMLHSKSPCAVTDD